ncbi:glucuronate isomerase [Microbacterium protaetiae]|uniref:Uronate isomerase n=1 Tax=Microbacterium protaetiae TaxID=2509458 RepID=A0A4P6EH39_9MICO|nr:glucuronate isomerase [Microbacterium protaetiae]QAY61772.1 glucuronate isomerase [Microbacterium protaetiae]
MKLELDPDRLFPADPQTRETARALYAAVADLPIISPHGHIDPRLLLDDEPFPDPAELFIRRDHYVTRLLHADGVDLADLGAGTSAGDDPRAIWRRFAERWHLFAGTASGYWLTHAFATLFDIDVEPDSATADVLYDTITMHLARDDYRPRALFHHFGIEVLATTDDPLDDLAAHTALAADPAFPSRVLPTFRPDAYLDPEVPGFAERVERLAAMEGTTPGDFAGYLEALESRRAYFIAHGAVSADHGVREPYTVELDEAEASALFTRALSGDMDAGAARAFRGNMLLRMAEMSSRDGLVMTIHPGVYRNHSGTTFDRFGADTGHDIPLTTTYAENLRPMLERVGLAPDLHIVLFTVDETSFSREIAPLAGFYPSLFIGAPWWFLDAPDAVQRFRSAVTETAGFYRGAGFIDDTRAFLSIPARHDMARRLDAAFLARLVREGRVSIARAERIATDLVDSLPRKVFKL